MTEQPRKLEKEVHRVWKPAVRDGRSYNEVVRSHISQGTTTKLLKDWLSVSFMCYQDDPIDLQHMNTMLEDDVHKNVIGSKIDDYSFLVSKVSEGKIIALDEEKLSTLRSRLKYMVP